MIEWKDSYCWGIKHIDDDHKKLFATANQLGEAIEKGDVSLAQIDSILVDLEVYAGAHFASEERLLKSAGFPSLEKHRAEHKQFVHEIGRLGTQLRAGEDEAASLEVYLKSWIENHVLKSDREYCDFMREADQHKRR